MDLPMIFDDNRPIAYLLSPNGEKIDTHGQSGVTSIKPYNENGELAPILWFAIYKGEEIHSRVNSKYVDCVGY